MRGAGPPGCSCGRSPAGSSRWARGCSRACARRVWPRRRRSAPSRPSRRRWSRAATPGRRAGASGAGGRCRPPRRCSSRSPRSGPASRPVTRRRISWAPARSSPPGVAARPRRRPGGALEIAHEGPALGEPTALTEWLPAADGRLRIAVFTAAGCRLCRTLGPALERLVAEGDAVLRTFEAESESEEVWAAVDVPGAPYAVAVGPDGRVLAKGTVNSEAQLRSVLAAAADRSAAPSPAIEWTVEDAMRAEVSTRRGGDGGEGDSRRAFLARAAGAAGALTVAPSVAALVRPGDAQAYHFCGHIYTTDSCPHPTGLPRIDARGRPLRARDGHAVDDLGRAVRGDGLPVGLLDPDGRPLPAAPRTAVCRAVARRFRMPTRVDGAWYRCCGGRVRKLVDCCAHTSRRINGDAALTATATPGGGSSASSTTTRGCRADRPRRRRPAGRDDRLVVAVRPLHALHAGPGGARRRATHHRGGVRRVRARRAGGRRAHLRLPRARGRRAGRRRDGGARAGRGGRARGRRAGGPGHADRPAGAPPGARALAPGAPAARGRGRLRRAAGDGLHHVRADVRRPGPGGRPRWRSAIPSPASCSGWPSAPGARCRWSSWRRCRRRARACGPRS